MTTEPTNQTLIFGLTAEELAMQAKEAGVEAIARMHSKGIAVVFSKDNVIYRQHPDGRLEPVDATRLPTERVHGL